MSDFVPNNRHLREVLIFFFHSKKTAAVCEAHRELQKVYGDAALSETTCRDWFRRFKDGDFDVDDRPREGRPKTFKDAELEALLDEDPCQTQEELASALEVTRQAISKRLHALGMIQKVDNARPHVAKPVKTYLETLKWEVLPHPPYSPDIAPSDYYLFRSMAHGLADQQFRSYEDIKKWLDSWIASKDEHFYRNGIRALSER